MQPNKLKLSVSTLFASVLLAPAAAFVFDWEGATALAATKVGSAAAVNTAAFGASPGAVRQVKLIGDNVVFNERIETSGTGLVQVLLNDGSTFTVGPNSDLFIDEFVYDPAGGDGKLVATFSKGVARFVGGKLSKKKGGVSVKTPVGTIGIRGGIANLDLSGENPVFSLVFGDELTFNGTDGKSRRIYQAGYSLEIGGGGDGVRRTTGTDLNSVQTSISSKPGQSGGSSVPPTNARVQSSGISQVNSDLGGVATAPRPKPGAVQATALTEAEATLVQVQQVTEEQTVTVIEEETVPDEVEEQTVDFRVLAAGSSFSPVWDTGSIVSTPGAQGLLGGSSGLDETVSFKVTSVNSGNVADVVEATVGGNEITQFRFEGSGSYFYSQAYTDQGDRYQEGNLDKVPVVPDIDTGSGASVTQYAWGAQIFNEDFLAFAHIPNVDPGGKPSFDIENMIVGLHGIGTDFGNFGDASDPTEVRRYALGTDPTTMFMLGTAQVDGSFTPFSTEALFVNPLVARQLGTDFLSDVGSTGLVMIEDASDTLDGSHFLAASFRIDGDGASQKSLVSLAVGEVFLDAGDGDSVMSSARRGGHRIDASQSAGLYGGPIGTMSASDGGEFFGSNAQSFVFGNALSGSALDDPYGDRYVERPSDFGSNDVLSATLHDGTLDESASGKVSSLSRTDRTLTGYAAGMLESTVNYGTYGADAVAYSSSSPDDLTITFDSSEHSLGGTLTVRDTSDLDPEIDSVTVAFGFNEDGSQNWRAAFVDDDTYAARDAGDRSQTYLTTDKGAKLEHRSDDNPNTYLISNTLVEGADSGIFVDKTKCTCAFLEWGYWGTGLNYDDKDGVLASTDERYDSFHLGTWVAGDVTDSKDLPDYGNATYTGHAVGNVVNNGAQYIAAGDFALSIDFGSRDGAASITNFDGRSMSANLSEQAIANGNLFSGSLTGGDLNGRLNTSFVSGPNSNHQGVIGDFNAVDGNWSAAGIVAAEQDIVGP